MRRISAFTIGELGIGLIIITFIILASAPIISHNNQQKQQTQAEYIASLNNGAEKSTVTKLKQQTLENEQKINALNTRLTGVEEYVRQYVGKTVTGTSNNNVISNSNPRVNDGSYVCNITGYTDAEGNYITPNPQHMADINKEIANGTRKIILTCGTVKR